MWTNVSKPTSSTYSYVNPQGREFYDDVNLLYDDPNAFYDGVNQAAWTDITKPTSSTWSLISKPI